MGKITVQHNSNFTIINNTIFRDRTISAKAKGLFVTMFSLPPNWDYTVRGLVTLFNDGETAIRSGLKELEEHGYLVRTTVRSGGRISDINYTLYEVPQDVENQTPSNLKSVKTRGDRQENLKQENQILENQILENRPELSTKGIKNLKNKGSKKGSQEKYLDRIEVILNEFDFSDKVKDEIIKYFRDRRGGKLVDDKIRGQLQVLASNYTSEKKQLEVISNSYNNDWGAICYPANSRSRGKAVDDISLTAQERQEMYENQKQLRTKIEQDPEAFKNKFGKF